MPSEDRRIMFSNDEVYKALYALCIQKQLKIPPAGQVVAIIEDSADTNKIYMDLENPQETTAARCEYSRDFLAAALMLFCRGCGIPLPKTAKKSVMINDSRVILRVII